MTQQNMQWENLYSGRRSDDAPDKQYSSDKIRNAFQKDYDRIIFSSAFRRLQNKTQVFPLPGPVFVHNRLTHSLEVASVGRTLGKLAGEKIADKYPDQSTAFHDFYRHELATVISAACLAHDIGNPPFGHSGEDAIRSYFTNLDEPIRQLLIDNFSENQLKDFDLFEGNSNAFRTLTHHFNEDASPYNLTITTLASIVKYPCTSAEGFKKGALVSTKKSGYFDTEINRFEAMAAAFGIPKIGEDGHIYARHPFVYLTEAADDICYRIIDMEDAHRLGIVSLEKIMELFLPFFAHETKYNTLDHIIERIGKIKDANQKVQYLRAVWISLMVNKLSDIFVANEHALLEGNLQDSLMDLLPGYYLDLLKEVNRFSVEKIYNHKAVVEIEIAGFHVIGGLLQAFVGAVLQPKAMKSRKLLELMSSQFAVTQGEEYLYANIQSVVDYISGMTDLYALDLYRKITGINISGL